MAAGTHACGVATRRTDQERHSTQEGKHCACGTGKANVRYRVEHSDHLTILSVSQVYRTK